MDLQYNSTDAVPIRTACVHGNGKEVLVTTTDVRRYQLRADELRTLAAEVTNVSARDVLLSAAEDYVELATTPSLVTSDRIRKRLMCFEAGAISTKWIRKSQ